MKGWFERRNTMEFEALEYPRDSIIQGALASRAAVRGGVVKLGLKSSPVPCQAKDPNLNAVHPPVGDLHYNSYKV